MTVTRDMLLQKLEPYKDQWVLIEADQEVRRDIIPEMVNGYIEFEPYYDKIGLLFEGNTVEDTCENLYKFCKDYIAYYEEPKEAQTSALPTGILTRGYCDCKGYASFIGGCLGAIARATGRHIDWSFCFASYKRWQRTPYHVFICVNTPDGALWVDPTPGADSMTPKHKYYARPYEQIAQVGGDGELAYSVGVTVTDPGVLDPQRTALLNSVAPGLGTTAASLMASLPEGNVKRFLRDLYSAGPFPWSGVQAVIKFLKGRTYTSGDYWTGETFLRNIVGRSDVQNRNQVPDQVVPIAWDFFSAAYGARMRTEDDFEALSRSATEYLEREPAETQGVTLEQAQRAQRVLNGAANPWNNRNSLWTPEVFNTEAYIYPIPGGAPGTLFTGTHPVLGLPFVDGYPVDQSVGDTIRDKLSSLLSGNRKYVILAGGALLVWYLSDND